MYGPKITYQLYTSAGHQVVAENIFGWGDGRGGGEGACYLCVLSMEVYVFNVSGA